MVISKKSSQMIYHEEDCRYVKKMRSEHRVYISESVALEKGYRPCSWCGGMHGVYLQLRTTPALYGKARDGLRESYDTIDKALCFRTEAGFWKILKQGEPATYRLWHLNHGDFDPAVSDRKLMRRSFHRQVDVKSTLKFGRIISYIHDHDKAKKIMDKDWKKLPNKTPKQRKYFKQAEKRERRKQNKRIDELFKKIEKGEL